MITILVISTMFDTVNFRLTADEVGAVSFIEETPCHLTDVGFHYYGGDTFVTGNLDGLKVTANQWQVKVKDGSLCKWFLGDNYKSMGRADVQQAIEKLSDLLHLPMNRASVTRLDVACNLITQHPTGVYYNHLGSLAYAKRLQQPNSLYYVKRDERLCFYDKNREQRAKREAVPELYSGRNVLRLEQRYMCRLPGVLKVPAVTGANLYDEAFYMMLLDRWRDTYKAIRKVNDTQLNFSIMKTRRDLQRLGILTLIDSVGGEVAFISQINEARQRGEITPKQAHDLREAVKQAGTAKAGVVVKSDAINELDKKVNEAVRFYR